MLYTNLRHIENVGDFENIIREHEYVVIICGRMDPTSVRLFSDAEEFSLMYRRIKFVDMEFDSPNIQVIIESLSNEKISRSPFAVFLKNGRVVNVIREFTGKEQFREVVNTFAELAESTYN